MPGEGNARKVEESDIDRSVQRLKERASHGRRACRSRQLGWHLWPAFRGIYRLEQQNYEGSCLQKQRAEIDVLYSRLIYPLQSPKLSVLPPTPTPAPAPPLPPPTAPPPTKPPATTAKH